MPIPPSPYAWTRLPEGRVLGLLLALGGCAVGPDYVKPSTPVPERWATAGDPKASNPSPNVTSQTPTDNLWWKSFNDPALDRLIELAYRQNLSLQVAGLRIAEARAQLGIAYGNRWPQTQLAFGSVMARGVSGNLTNFAIVDRRFVDFQVGLDVAWELDFWGKYRRAIDSQESSLLASQADYDSALVSLTAEVARVYVSIRTFEVLVAQARTNAALQEEGLKIARSRFKNGATSELDVTQATTLLESTRASIPQLQANLTQARNALSTLLAQPPGTLDELLAGPKVIPATPPKIAIGVPVEMLRRRPDIRSAEQVAAAQSARIGVAKADLYPSFSLIGSFGLQASDGHTFFSEDSIFYSVGPRVSWAFLNYGRITNNVRVEDARFQQSLVTYHDTVLKAAQEVEDALAALTNAQEAVTFEQNAVTSAESSVRIALVEYREGAANYQRVLDAQRSLLQEQNTLASLTSSVATSVITLYKALGGGWEIRQGQPIIPEKTQNEMKGRTDWGDLLTQPRKPESTASPPPAKP